MPFAGVGDGIVEAASEHADGEGGDGDAPVVEDLEELGEPPPALAEQVVLGHAALDEREPVRVGRVPAHLAVRRLHLEAGRARRDQDRRDLARPGERGHRHHRRDRRAGVGDERLAPVDHPLAARRVVGRPGARPAGVGAGVGLGQPERAERATGAQVGQPALLLLGRAEGVDRVGAEADAGLQGDGDRLVDPGELLDRHAQPGEVTAATAHRLGEGDAEQPQLAHRQHGGDGELVGAIPLGGVRLDLGVGELTHQRAQRVVLVAQLRHHRRQDPI